MGKDKDTGEGIREAGHCSSTLGGAAQVRGAPARMYKVLPLVCPNRKGKMCLVAFVTERSSIERILTHIGEPTVPPPITRARAPPDLGVTSDSVPP